MLNLNQLSIDYLVDEIQKSYSQTYSDFEPRVNNVVSWTARLALEIIANTDALYHNMDHTVMVTLAGLSIIEGKHLKEGGVTPQDWLQYMVALLCHDIGYVRGVLQLDNGNRFATGVGDEMVTLPATGTDVSLTPYHVDRSKQFIRERFGNGLLDGMDELIDAERICEYIEFTRFPPRTDPAYQDTSGFGGLTRAADFIGQLGDPNYLRKTPALYYEFEETNANQQLGYSAPTDLRKSYAGFFWNIVNPYIQDAIKYLSITQRGKQWIANLYAQVFTVEHDGA
jgi:hypothetical protein